MNEKDLKREGVNAFHVYVQLTKRIFLQPCVDIAIQDKETNKILMVYYFYYCFLFIYNLYYYYTWIFIILIFLKIILKKGFLAKSELSIPIEELGSVNPVDYPRFKIFVQYVPGERDSVDAGASILFRDPNTVWNNFIFIYFHYFHYLFRFWFWLRITY